MDSESNGLLQIGGVNLIFKESLILTRLFAGLEIDCPLKHRLQPSFS
jgi:hypothetical protein